MITRDDVIAARERIGGRIRRTPVLDEGPLVLKLELTQHTGSFKARGAFNRQLAAHGEGLLDPEVGVVAASGGNAGLAHAYAARELGWPVAVFVPRTAPAVKVDRLRSLGASVVPVGTEYAVAYEAAVLAAGETGAVLCHAYDQPEVAAGAGTLALELLEDAPTVDTVVVSVGGGGLMAGVAAALEGRVRVVAVEPETIPTLASAVGAGTPVDVSVSGVAADSLGARRIGDIALDVARRTGVTSLLVEEEAIIEARSRLWQERRLAVEHGASTAYAALVAGVYVPAPDERVAVVLCGANTDPATLQGPLGAG